MTRPAALCLATFAIALAGCGEEREPTTTGGTGTTGGTETTPKADGGTITIAGEKAVNKGEEDVAGASRVEMELDDFYFAPTLLKGEPGQRITIAMRNEGQQLHNLALRDQDIDRDVEPGASASVNLRFPRSGQLVFVCKYHTAQNMRGGLDSGAKKKSGGSGDSASSGSDDGGYGY
jgi:plastocyanin